MVNEALQMVTTNCAQPAGNIFLHLEAVVRLSPMDNEGIEITLQKPLP
ncbi:MAG: hypothetical protein WAV95_05685 [Azonexus sp.]